MKFSQTQHLNQSTVSKKVDLALTFEFIIVLEMRTILSSIENTELQRISSLKLHLKTFQDISSTTYGSIANLNESLAKTYDDVSALDDVQQYIRSNSLVSANRQELIHLYHDAGHNIIPRSQSFQPSPLQSRTFSNPSLSNHPQHQQSLNPQALFQNDHEGDYQVISPFFSP